MGEHRPTLVKPPPQDTSKAPIENALELTDLSVIGPVSHQDIKLDPYIYCSMYLDAIKPVSYLRALFFFFFFYILITRSATSSV